MASELQISAYPTDLASFVLKRWQAGSGRECAELPDRALLEHVISICYQASLLREEGRPVRFRVIFLAPDRFPPDLGPPAGLHRLLFRDKPQFTGRELRKLSPSVDFYDSLIGVWHDEDGGLTIWGIVHSGMRWTQSLYGGGKELQPLPASLVINVTDPGRITVCNGSIEIATLNAGEIVSPSMAVFDSMWVRSLFVSFADEELALHTESRIRAEKSWAALDPEFFEIIKKQAFMRIIGRVRSNRHGGTLIFIPDDLKEEFLAENPYIKLKYRFVDEEPCRRFRTLIVKMADALTEFYSSPEDPEKVVGWAQYLTSKNKALSWLDESVFEWAHMVAGMTQVDGAVVITERLELVGFGAQISGRLERVHEIAKALDPEGVGIRKEQTDSVGTRHNSAYSLCNSLHEVVAVVSSQDGTAQLVKWNDGIVTIWEQLSPSLIDA